jgi:hypothetical protein
MQELSALRQACAQLAWLAETLSDRYPQTPQQRRDWLGQMRQRMAEVEAACLADLPPAVDPSGTDPLQTDDGR